ncbi:MAG: hypothetical protein JW945_00545 [Methanomicrobia archaeon]|nr:hypothetical protein [Methanomicrobia archaeon]
MSAKKSVLFFCMHNSARLQMAEDFLNALYGNRAITTVTTVGYGDLYPESMWGRILAIIVMVIGIGFFCPFYS